MISPGYEDLETEFFIMWMGFRSMKSRLNNLGSFCESVDKLFCDLTKVKSPVRKFLNECQVF